MNIQPWNYGASVLTLCYQCWSVTYGSFSLRMMGQKLYHWATNAGQQPMNIFSWIHSFCCQQWCANLNLQLWNHEASVLTLCYQRQCLNSNLQPWNYSTTLLPMLACNLWIFFMILDPSVASGSVQTQTLSLGMARVLLMCYQCWPAPMIFFMILLLPVACRSVWSWTFSLRMMSRDFCNYTATVGCQNIGLADEEGSDQLTSLYWLV